jgi:HD-GYP domain-containing protein (c-di-GMP phosphodiesterase class II)
VPRVRVVILFLLWERSLVDTENSSRMRQFVTGMPGQKDDTSIQLEAIFRAFSDMLFVLDQHGVILEYRAGDTNLLYLPPDQFLGKPMQDVMPAEVGEKFAKAIESAGRPDEITTLNYKLHLPQGERWFEAHLVFSSNVQIVVIIRDITTHVETTERVRQQLRQISALHAIDVAITSSFDLKVTLSVILREVLNQLAVDAADVLLFNQTTHLLEFAGGQGFLNQGFEHTPVRIGQGYAGTAALERRTISASEFDVHGSGILTDIELKAEGFISYYAVPLMAKGLVKGVLEIYNRSPLKPGEAWLEFLAALASRAALAVDSAELFQNLQQTNTELSLAYDSAIAGWSQALEISGRENNEHTRRVLDLTMRLAQDMGIKERDLAQIHRGVLLHDIGNLGIPELVLLKPAPLTEPEWAIVRDHPNLAIQMLQSIPFLSPALDIPYSHHERWDGSGYPDGLQGEKIPMAARVFAVVDVYDALISSRPYRSAWTAEEALNYIRDQSGKLFDPKIVSKFLDMMARLVPGEETTG